MKKLGRVVVISAAMFVANTAAAEDWQLTVAPALDFAFKKSDSTFTFLGVPYSTQWTGSPSYTAFVPSLSASYGPIFGSISYDNPLAAWRSASADFANDQFTDNSYSRKEATVTVGYRLPWSVNVFAGYVHGRSDQMSIMYDTTDPAANRVDPARFTFDEKGFYLGASYSHQFGDKGTLSVTGAYGNMDGEMELLDSSGTTTLTSTSPGYSLGLNWTGPLTGNLVYRTGIKMTNYVFNFDTFAFSGFSFAIPKDYYELEETIYTFTIGVANYF